jgi:hypothetical protein
MVKSPAPAVEAKPPPAKPEAKAPPKAETPKAAATAPAVPAAKAAAAKPPARSAEAAQPSSGAAKTAPAKPPAPPAKDVDLDALERSLGSVSKPAPAPLAAARPSSADLIGLIAGRLVRAWNPNCSAAGADSMAIRVRVSLTAAGGLAKPPEVIRIDGQGGGAQSAADAAVRAVARAAPYLELPRDRYEEWRSFVVRFDGASACAGRG